MSTPDLKKLRWQIDVGGLAACLLLTAAVFMLGLKPVLDREAERAAQRQRVVQKQREAEEAMATLTIMRNNLVKFREAVQASAIQLQTTNHLNQRVAEITDLATLVGLQVNAVQPGGVTAGERYDTVPIQLGGSGGYADFAQFLNRLHDAFPDVGVASLELTGKPSVPGEPAEYRLGLTWYAAPRPSATTTASAEP